MRRCPVTVRAKLPHVRYEPALACWPTAGVYQLWLRVSGAVTVTVGRAGRFRFPAGIYVYTGRAARGLVARVTRHAVIARRRPSRYRRRWHIDYLLATRSVQLIRIVLVSPRPDDECAANQAIHGRVTMAGFGASDCRAGCGAHLLRWR